MSGKLTSRAGQGSPEEESGPQPSAEDLGAQVLDIVRALVAELHPNLVDPRLVRLGSDLDRDLALDSLSRAELLMRLSRHFEIELPETLLGEAGTPQDIATNGST